MKKLSHSHFDFPNLHENHFLFNLRPVASGLSASENMKATPNSISTDLEEYFKTVKNGKYFSITKRKELKSDPEAKKGVKALQQLFIDNGIFDAAETDLKNPNSDFRKKLEAIGKGASSDSNNTDLGRSLFSKSLNSFDAKGGLFKEVDGDYGHSTRLAVAYLQWQNGAKIDGAFGTETLGLIGNLTTKANLVELKRDVIRDTSKNADDKKNDYTKKRTGPAQATQGTQGDNDPKQQTTAKPQKAKSGEKGPDVLSTDTTPKKANQGTQGKNVLEQQNLQKLHQKIQSLEKEIFELMGRHDFINATDMKLSNEESEYFNKMLRGTWESMNEADNKNLVQGLLRIIDKLKVGLPPLTQEEINEIIKDYTITQTRYNLEKSSSSNIQQKKSLDKDQDSKIPVIETVVPR